MYHVVPVSLHKAVALDYTIAISSNRFFGYGHLHRCIVCHVIQTGISGVLYLFTLNLPLLLM